MSSSRPKSSGNNNSLTLRPPGRPNDLFLTSKAPFPVLLEKANKILSEEPENVVFIHAIGKTHTFAF